MPYVTKYAVRIGPDGKKHGYSYKVWVPGQPEPAKTGQSASQQNAAQQAAAKAQQQKNQQQYASDAAARARQAAAQATARLIAAAHAREEQIAADASFRAQRAAAQNKMWADLKNRSIEVRDVIAPPTQGKKKGGAPISLPPGTPTNAVSTTSGQGAKNARLMNLQDDKALKRWAVYDGVYVGSQRDAVLKVATTGSMKNTPAGGKLLERLIREAREGQVASNGKNIDTAFVEDVLTKYQEYLTDVRMKVVKIGTDLEALMVFDENKVPLRYKNEAAYKQAERILNDAKNKAALDEHDRVYGTDEKNVGDAALTFNVAKSIGDDQRRYIRDAAYESFVGTEIGGPKTAGRMKTTLLRLKEWNEDVKWLFDQSVEDIDPANTSWMFTRDKDGKRIQRRRTVEEEFEYRQAQYQADLTREYNAARNQAVLRANLARDLAKHKGKGMGAMGPTKMQQSVEIADALKALNFQEGDLENNPHNLHLLVEKGVELWELKNKHHWQNADPRATGMTGGVTAGQDGMSIRDRHNFEQARDRYEERFRSWVHAESGGPLMDAFNWAQYTVPGAEGLFTTIGGVGGLITTLQKLDYMGETGSSTFITTQDPDAVPDSVKRAAKAAGEAAWIAAGRPPPPDWRGYDSPASIQSQAATDYIENWRTNTPEGQEYWRELMKGKMDLSHRQDQLFTDRWLDPSADIWERMRALSDYGFNVTDDPLINFGLSIGLDPTVAMPFNFFTWGNRARYAMEAAQGQNALRKLWTIPREFQKVQGAELRSWQLMKPFDEMLAEGKTPAQIEDAILQRVAGITDETQRAKEIRKTLIDLGMNPRTPEGSLELNQVQQRLIEKWESMGVNYRDLTGRAQELYGEALAAEMKAKQAAAPHAAAVDESRAYANAQAQRQAQSHLEDFNIEREAAIDSAITKLAADQLQTQADDALRAEAHIPGDADNELFRRTDDDPLRRAATESNAYGPKSITADDVLYKADGEQDAADLMQMVYGQGDMVDVHGELFSHGEYWEEFKKSDDFAEIDAILSSARQTKRVSTRSDLPEEFWLRKLDQAEVTDAWRRLREAGRESVYSEMRYDQAVGRSQREGPIPGGMLVQSTRDGVNYSVVGGRSRSQQHIDTSGQLQVRAGYGSPAEAWEGMKFDRAYRSKIKRLKQLYKARYETPEGPKRMSQEDFDEKVLEVREAGYVRNHVELSVDLRSTTGSFYRAELDHILNNQIEGFIPVGEIAYREIMSTGSVSYHYQTLSLLKEMASGVGYETKLMEDILNPHFRASLTRAGFASMMRRSMFTTPNPSPQQFREGMQHLYALFHLTLLDAEQATARMNDLMRQLKKGEIDPQAFDTMSAEYLARANGSYERLLSYSQSIAHILTIKETGEHNMFARAWQVMEARAGVPWRQIDGTHHIEVETNFVTSALHKTPDVNYENWAVRGQLHPNLALRMIPAGPVVRATSVTHGYTGHLRNAGTTLSRLFRMSDPRWSDDDVTRVLTTMVTRDLSHEQMVQLANQVSHYHASRYGSTLRRPTHGLVVYDFSLDRLHELRSTSPEAETAYQQLRQRYIAEMLPNFKKSSLKQAYDPVTASLVSVGKMTPLQLNRAAIEHIGSQFDLMFTKKVKKGHKRRQYNSTVRHLYEELYWEGRISHDNVGLHTSMFLAKMGDPFIARGDSYIRYANAFFDHLEGAGAGAQASEVISVLFRQRIIRHVSAIADEQAAMGQAITGPIPGQWHGAERELFIKAKVLGNIKMAVEASRRRKHASEAWNEAEAVREAERGDWYIADRERGELEDLGPAGRGGNNMYDYASIEDILDDVAGWAETSDDATQRLAKLEHGLTAFDVAKQKLDEADELVARIEARIAKEVRGLKTATEKRFYNKRPDDLVAAEKAQNLALGEAKALARRVKAEEVAAAAVEDAQEALARVQAKSRGSDADVERVNAANLAMKAAMDHLEAIRTSPHAGTRRVTTGQRRPPETRMKFYHRTYKSILYGNEEKLSPAIVSKLPDGTATERASAYVRSLPNDSRTWVELEIIQAGAQRNVKRGLNSAVYRSIHRGAIPESVADEMQRLVGLVKQMVGGEEMLAEWAQLYYNDLLHSRLIDFLKHEEWFKFADETQDQPLVQLMRDVVKLEDEVKELDKFIKDGYRDLNNVREKFTKRDLDGLRANRDKLQAELDAKRVEGQDILAGRKPGMFQPVKPESRRFSLWRKLSPSELKNRVLDAEGALPFKPDRDEGWRLHLGLDLSDLRSRNAAEAVLSNLKKRGLIKDYRLGVHASGRQGREAIVHVGGRDAAEFIAEELDRSLRSHLREATANVVDDDVQFIGNVWGRFDVGGRNPRSVSIGMDSHGGKGHAWLRSDSAARKRAPDGYPDQDAVLRARQKLEEVYGEYFTGGANEQVRPPSADELNHRRIRNSTQGLEILDAMAEDKWLAAELKKAKNQRTNLRGAERRAMQTRIQNLEKAIRVVEYTKSGAKGPFISVKNERSFVREAVSLVGERAKLSFAGKHITSYVTGPAGAEVEQVRMLYRLLRRASVDPKLDSAVRVVGEVSDTYKTHGEAIERVLGQPIPRALLAKYGLEGVSDISATMLLTQMDEFENLMRDRTFSDFVTEVSHRVNYRLEAITRDQSYSVERWLDDRLTQRADHLPSRVYEDLDRKISAVGGAEKHGVHRWTRTDLRSGRKQMQPGPNPLAESFETDIRIVVAKAKVFADEGVDPHAYAEARRVLRPAYLRKKYALEMIPLARERAAAALYAAGKKVEDKNWDKLYDDEYAVQFLKLRDELADDEAVKLLDQMVREEFIGASMDEIITEFERRYSMDADLKDREPPVLTPFQHRTLIEAIKTHSGVTDVNDPSQMAVALSAHGQAPPFHNRELMRDWLTKYGFWSPRTAEAVESGNKSWSIQEEAEYYMTGWGRVPDWANPDLLDVNGDLRHILFDAKSRGDQYRKWGLFNRNMEARFATGAMSRGERARFLVEGSEALGLKAKRDLPLERKYVKERFGELVQDEQGNLTAFPELMTPAELETYIGRISKDETIPHGMIQNADELRIFHQLIDKHVQRMSHRYMAGDTVTFADNFAMAADIVAEMLLDPIWLKRDRDAIGAFIRGQATFRRNLVMTQIAFLAQNVVDTTIKGPWAAFVTRSFHNGPISARALAFTLYDFGFTPHGQLLYDQEIHGTSLWKQTNRRAVRYKDSNGQVIERSRLDNRIRNGVQKTIAVSQLPSQGAGMAEDVIKLRLAQQIYDGAYSRAFKKWGDDGRADAYARLFAKNEVNRFWPTQGDGPLEQLFNQLSPFMSYQFKNRTVFIGEMMSHPAMFNYFNRIGDEIERINLEEWAANHSEHEEMPENLRRLVHLPWTPHGEGALYIDLGQWSDAGHALKPVYDIANGKATVGSLASQFVRLAGANDINIVLGLFNQFDIGQRYEWLQGKDANGYANGVWTRVQVPWEAPWGEEAHWANSFWPVEWVKKAQQALEGGFTASAVTQLVYQTLFFGGIKQYDRGAGLNSYFWTLQEKNKRLAKDFLETPDGKALQMWWADRVADTQEFYLPEEVRDILNPPGLDKNPWLHTKSQEFQDKVHQGFEDLDNIRKRWDNIIWKMQPGSQEMADARMQKSLERYAYYRTHPWMYEYEAFSMTPEEWATQLSDWQVDDLVDNYYALTAPDPDDFDSALEFERAKLLWKQQRLTMLEAFPPLRERLAETRDSVDAIWTATEQGWFDILDRIGTRKVAIEAAKQAGDFDLVDQLYLANDLDYKQLNVDVAVSYFDPTTDWNTLPTDRFGREIQGPKTLRQDPFGNPLLKRIQVLPDFNSWRFARMNDEEKAKYARDRKYGQGMKAVIDAAKASGTFDPAVFVQQLKKDPWLLAEYFRNNPGKREQWQATDEYISIIGKFGQLMRAGKFDQGYRYFDSMPAWVKERYYAKHPEKRQNAVQNLEYMNWMKRWTNFYQRRDYQGGAEFFERMPQWVKDRYYGKHPDGFGKGGKGGNSPYAKAMGHWVELLKAGKKDEAKKFFDSMPQAFRDRYYAKHPDAELRDDIKRTGQLGEYFLGDDAFRAQYLKDNPEFARWLQNQMSDEDKRRMVITAGYRAIPDGPDAQWMRRVYREKYPEVFSKEAAGERALAKVYAFLAEHPEMLPAYEKWLEAVLESFEENKKHTKTQPKPFVRDHTRQRRGHREGRSAAWVRLHAA